mgnify:CR=1 FL=1
MDFDAILPALDEKTNERLGNSVGYSSDDGATFPIIKAFVLIGAEGENTEFGNLDPLNHGDRLKVAKAIVPVPSKDHIVRHAKLPGDMRPEQWQTVEGGRYWLIDLQKA